MRKFKEYLIFLLQIYGCILYDYNIMVEPALLDGIYQL